MRRTTATIMLLWVAAARGQDAPPVAVTAADAKTLVQDFCYGDAKKKAAAREKLERARAEDRKGIFDAFGAVKFKPQTGAAAPKGRRIKETFDVPESETGKGTFIVVLPAKYDPAKPWPLVFRFHGSGDDCENFSKGWETVKAADGVIAVIPEIPSKGRMGWNEPGATPFVDRLYKQLIRRFNVDTDRVYFTGHSAGSGASFVFAGLWPERPAGLYGSARLHFAFHLDREASMEVVKNVPGYFAVGLKDTEERVQGYKDAEDFAKRTKAPWIVKYMPNRGHEYFRELDQPAFEYLFKQKRPRPPKEFSALFFGYTDSKDNDFFTGQHWLRGKKFDVGRGTPCKVAVKDNVVSIDAPRLDAGSILLCDELVKMDEPVIVQLDGKEVFRGVVERSVKFLLDRFDDVGDPRRLFWNEVEFSR